MDVLSTRGRRDRKDGDFSIGKWECVMGQGGKGGNDVGD